MKIEDILDQWKIDAQIDQTDLGGEAISIPKLHHKYFQMYIQEKLSLRSHEADMKKLKLDKYEFYTQGHNDQTRNLGWELPSRGMILKADIPMYMDADKDLVKLSLKIGVQQEKIELLESIIKSLTNRGFQIKSAIDWQKFTMGA